MSDVLSAEQEFDAAFRALSESRRLLAHATACPAMHDGGCACGAEEAAGYLAALARSHEQLRGERDEWKLAYETKAETLERISARAEAAARAGGCAADALGRLVADLETNSERGAPDYAHDALAAHDRAVSGQTAEADET